MSDERKSKNFEDSISDKFTREEAAFIIATITMYIVMEEKTHLLDDNSAAIDIIAKWSTEEQAKGNKVNGEKAAVMVETIARKLIASTTEGETE